MRVIRPSRTWTVDGTVHEYHPGNRGVQFFLLESTAAEDLERLIAETRTVVQELMREPPMSGLDVTAKL